MIHRARGTRLATAVLTLLAAAWSFSLDALRARPSAAADAAAHAASGTPASSPFEALAAEARRIVGADQGVHVETEDGTVLVVAGLGARGPSGLGLEGSDDAGAPAQARPRPPLRDALLWPRPDPGRRLAGPLVVRADGDPYFVDENALLVARALRELGSAAGRRATCASRASSSSTGRPTRSRRGCGGPSRGRSRRRPGRRCAREAGGSERRARRASPSATRRRRAPGADDAARRPTARSRCSAS